MFYYVWHGTEERMKPTYDNTRLLETSPDNPAWGPPFHYHWWGRPWLGYYDAGNHDVIYKHLQMLCDAGVDFLVFDCTNGLAYCDRIRAVIDVIRERRQNGMRAPLLACMTHTAQGNAVADLWENLYSKSEYDDVWYRRDGAPLLMCDMATIHAEVEPADILAHFTLRHSWAWTGGKEDTWSWLDHYPQGTGYTVRDGKKLPECISVGTAQHPSTGIGKSFSGGKQPEVNGKGLCDLTPQGLYYAEQWRHARSLPDSLRPPVVFITQWNEFIAMRFPTADRNGADSGKVRPGGKAGDMSESYFIDAYNAEFNRDVEPSSHPLIRDNYYMQTVEEIRRYRGVSPLPLPECHLTIDIEGPWEQWNQEPLQFTDDKGDNMQISVAQSGGACPVGNDITACKVTDDTENMYFLVETCHDIAWDTAAHPMRLLLDTDCDNATGWCGYDCLIERDSVTRRYLLKRYAGDGTDFIWQTAAEPLRSRREKTRLMIEVPKRAMEREGDFDIDFKWIDNCPVDSGEPMLMYSDGDCAPNHRFNYRYKGSAPRRR